MANRLPMLTGYRVLDITQFVAGPTCSRILGEMGADVIKVELAPEGDRVRALGMKPIKPEFKNSSQSTYYFQHNHSKRSLAVNIKDPRGVKLLHDLIPKIDVVVENFAPGVMPRNGMGYEELRKLNPKLIMLSISVVGQTGPLADRAGYDQIGQAYSGVSSLIGEPDRAPAMVPVAIGDVATGVAAAMAVGFALLHRERTGEGQYLDASLVDTYFHFHETFIPRVSLRKGKFIPQRGGSQHPDGGPTGTFHYKDDQYVYIVMVPHQWPQLVKAMGMPELADDPRFNGSRARRDNMWVLKEIVEDWLRTFPTREAALAALDRERVPCAPVLNLYEAMQEPQLRQRQTVRAVKDPQLGEFDITNVPVKFSAWPTRTDVKASLLGQDNEVVVKELLGLSDAEITELYQGGVLVHDPLLDQKAGA